MLFKNKLKNCCLTVNVTLMLTPLKNIEYQKKHKSADVVL